MILVFMILVFLIFRPLVLVRKYTKSMIVSSNISMICCLWERKLFYIHIQLSLMMHFNRKIYKTITSFLLRLNNSKRIFLLKFDLSFGFSRGWGVRYTPIEFLSNHLHGFESRGLKLDKVEGSLVELYICESKMMRLLFEAKESVRRSVKKRRWRVWQVWWSVMKTWFDIWWWLMLWLLKTCLDSDISNFAWQTQR